MHFELYKAGRFYCCGLTMRRGSWKVVLLSTLYTWFKDCVKKSNWRTHPGKA